MPEPVRIFVSHSHQDNEYCRAYVAGLRSSGYSVWYDEHNLGWGQLRATIDSELLRSQHFVAILSAAAVASQWVNSEIDAALDLLRQGVIKTFLLVIAERCDVPPTLRGWRRIEGPGGAPVGVAEAVARTLNLIGAPAEAPRAQPAIPPTPPAHVAPPDRFPPRLASLGYRVAFQGGAEVILPPLCAVPAGPFLMGSDPNKDKDAQEDEQPQHWVTLAAYQIAIYPVTVAEYACFVRATGRATPTGEDGKPYQVGWQTQQSQRLDHPVVMVNWRDETTYAHWLAERTGQPWRLPSEAEWEKAARWDAATGNARLYPWGDTFDASRCNTSEGKKGTTTPVGSYPGGASPYGALDMAGNVWEGTSTVYQPYPYTASDGIERAESTENRVLRGGSWGNLARSARAAFRDDFRPGGVGGLGGFRLVLAAPIS